MRPARGIGAKAIAKRLKWRLRRQIQDQAVITGTTRLAAYSLHKVHWETARGREKISGKIAMPQILSGT